MIRRVSTVLLLFLLFVLLLGTASADAPEGRLTPGLDVMREHAAVVVKPTTLQAVRKAAAGETLTIRLYKDVAPAYGVAGQWHVVPSREGSWRYEFYFGEWSSEFGDSWVIHRQRAGASASYTGCVIVAPGDYRLLINVYDPDTGERLVQSSYRYTIAADEDHPTLDDLAARIVAEQQGATQYETALALYDWVTSHMYYDDSLSYYGADGALLRGYGVCDSYSKGYCLLLKAAGIPYFRISSSNHAWNVVQLDGQWYQADPTWDDPGSQTVPFSGLEAHEYFCITDDLMLRSGHSYTPSSERVCDSLALNYYVMNGGWDAWNLDFQASIQALWEQGLYGAGAYAFGETERHLTILAWIYNHRPESLPAWVGSTPATFYYVFETNVFSVAATQGRQVEQPYLYIAGAEGATLSGYLGFGDTLTIPDTLGGLPVTAVEAGAFHGDTRLVKVEFPGTLTAVGSDAFSACPNLQLAVVDGALAVLGDRAFRDCPQLRTLELPATLSVVGEDAIPEGMLLSCPVDSSLARALGGALLSFTDPEEPDWLWLWLMDGDEPELAAAACLSADTRLTLPDRARVLLDVGDCPLLLLTLPDTLDWISVECTLPDSLICLITTSGQEDAILLGQREGVPVLLRDRQSTLPGAIRDIGDEAYSGSGLHWLIIPPGTASIGAGAFSGSSLAAVTFYATATDLDSAAFAGSSPVVFAPKGSQVYADLTDLGLPVLDN